MICDNEFDSTAVNYFMGLNYEMLQNEAKMTECYEKIRTSHVKIEFSFFFHPYYRTAKFAQREAECSKAVYYYSKALAFYDGTEPTAAAAKTISFIFYDIATVYMYMHEYDNAERFLDLSYQYDKSTNQQRDFINVILHAVRGRWEESNTLLTTLPSSLREIGKNTMESIRGGIDLHYCAVSQDRSLYGDFWKSMQRVEEQLCGLIAQGNYGEAETIISEKLTSTLQFMERKLECRVEENDGKIIVKCKNYCVKSLMAEHAELFAMERDILSDWEFVSVREFECF